MRKRDLHEVEVTLSDGSTATVVTPGPLDERGKAQVVRLLERERAREAEQA